MKKLIISVSILLAFMPSVALAEVKRVSSVPEKRNDCVTVSIDGRIERYCINHPDGVIVNNDFFRVCMEHQEALDAYFNWFCYIRSDSGQDNIPVAYTGTGYNNQSD